MIAVIDVLRGFVYLMALAAVTALVGVMLREIALGIGWLNTGIGVIITIASCWFLGRVTR
jgi:hypothetical protein